MKEEATWERAAETAPGALEGLLSLIPDLWLRVAEAARWCQDVRAPTGIWSPLLDPGLLGPVGELSISRAPEVRSRLEQGVEALVARRRAQVGPLPPLPPTAPGGLLWYLPEQNLCDGAAESSSDGLFNVQNLPGWCTWLALRDLPPPQAHRIVLPVAHGFQPTLVLLAWIPAPLLAPAARGVWNNPEGCIGWLTDPVRP